MWRSMSVSYYYYSRNAMYKDITNGTVNHLTSLSFEYWLKDSTWTWVKESFAINTLRYMLCESTI